MSEELNSSHEFGRAMRQGGLRSDFIVAAERQRRLIRDSRLRTAAFFAGNVAAIGLAVNADTQANPSLLQIVTDTTVGLYLLHKGSEQSRQTAAYKLEHDNTNYLISLIDQAPATKTSI